MGPTGQEFGIQAPGSSRSSSAWGVSPVNLVLKDKAADRRRLIYVYGSSGSRSPAVTRTRDRISTRGRKGIVAPLSSSLHHGWRGCCHLGLIGWYSRGRYHSQAELNDRLPLLTVSECLGSDPVPEVVTRNISAPT